MKINVRKYGKFLLVSLIVFFSIASLSIFAGAVILYKYSDSCVEEEIIELASNCGRTEFYRYETLNSTERSGESALIGDATLNSEKKSEYVRYDKIPKKMVDAFIAIEDKRFWDHNGIDFLRSSRAAVNYAFGGRKSFGGSTITQQLVKNLTGEDEHNVRRKIKEAFSAINLEREYDKTEIIEKYLNIINLSHGCAGVGAAAKYYFSKDVSELDLCEIAAIAAITNNPSRYDPIRHPEENKKRRELVLALMLEQNFISKEEYADAVDLTLTLNIGQSTKQGASSWYIDTVIEDVITDLSKKFGISRATASTLLYKGGYKIYTLMDADIQDILNAYFSDTGNFPTDNSSNTPQASMVVIDPYTGDVLGIAGAVGKKSGSRLFNYATDSKRPSGSAIKPLSVYAPAIDRGIVSWSTLISDSPIREEGKNSTPWPSNANKKYLGEITVDFALRNSTNTVAVKLLHEVGNKKSFDFLRNDLKITSLDPTKDMGDASLALGQHTEGITLCELVAAYSIFEEGIMSTSRTYAKVTDMNGKVILDNPSRQAPVISRECAAVMTKLMQGVVEDGTATGLITLNGECEVAGKTGTTQYSFDKYFVGYTPTLLAGVWQGYPMPKPIDLGYSNYSAIIWDDVMCQIYEKTDRYSDKSAFDIPQNVKLLSYDTKTGLFPNYSTSLEDMAEGWFIQGNNMNIK